jgi:nucleotide-binding universal stress UspA family protein
MYSEILLPIDLDEPSSWTKALPTAVDLCRASQARLHMLTVVPEFRRPGVVEFLPNDYERRVLSGANQRLNMLIEERVPPAIATRPIVATGTIYKVIIDTADGIPADLIVMASHRPELEDYLLGPDAARVVRHACRSVLIVR